MFNVLFNGVSIPNFIKVTSIAYSVLPDGINKGSKVIDMALILVNEENKNMATLGRELASWLKGDNFALSPLVFTDDREVTYMASVSTAPSIEDLIFYGECSIQFNIPSGCAVGETKVVTKVVPAENINIEYNGLLPSFPLITITPNYTNSANAPITITDKVSGKVIRLSGPINEDETITIDCAKKVVKRGNKVDMLLIEYNSDWIKLTQALHVLSVNVTGTCSIVYAENY